MFYLIIKVCKYTYNQQFIERNDWIRKGIKLNEPKKYI